MGKRGRPRKNPEVQDTSNGNSDRKTNTAINLHSKGIVSYYGSMEEFNHLTPKKVAKAMRENDTLLTNFVEFGPAAYGIDGVRDTLEQVLRAIPKRQKRNGARKLTPEEREEREHQRKLDLWNAMVNSELNDTAVQALEIAYLRGLKGDERKEARDELRKSMGL